VAIACEVSASLALRAATPAIARLIAPHASLTRRITGAEGYWRGRAALAGDKTLREVLESHVVSSLGALYDYACDYAETEEEVEALEAGVREGLAPYLGEDPRFCMAVISRVVGRDPPPSGGRALAEELGPAFSPLLRTADRSALDLYARLLSVSGGGDWLPSEVVTEALEPAARALKGEGVVVDMGAVARFLVAYLASPAGKGLDDGRRGELLRMLVDLEVRGEVSSLGPLLVGEGEEVTRGVTRGLSDKLERAVAEGDAEVWCSAAIWARLRTCACIRRLRVKS
jgi:hypothetical protein